MCEGHSGLDGAMYASRSLATVDNGCRCFRMLAITTAGCRCQQPRQLRLIRLRQWKEGCDAGNSLFILAKAGPFERGDHSHECREVGDLLDLYVCVSWADAIWCKPALHLSVAGMGQRRHSSPISLLDILELVGN